MYFCNFDNFECVIPVLEMLFVKNTNLAIWPRWFFKIKLNRLNLLKITDKKCSYETMVC